MAQSIVINSVTYPDVPSIEVPKSTSGTAVFYDTSASTAAQGDILSGKKAFGASGEITGNIQSKATETFKPLSTVQTINSGVYLSGNQTISAVTCTNLTAANIKAGVTVKIGCSADDDSVTSVLGTLALPSISQDGTTKVLSIS